MGTNLDDPRNPESHSSEHASDSSSADSDSSSGSDAELRLSRPIFLKKKQPKAASSSHDAVRGVLARAEHLQKIESKSSEKVPFDGVDDSDDVDPEAEYRQWKLREVMRRKRDMALIAEAEQAKEDAVRRKKGLSSGNDNVEGSLENGGVQPKKSTKLGGFYAGNTDEKFLKRDYKNVEGQEDHSRPTKYKRE